MAAQYPGINTYLQLVQVRLANNPDYVQLSVRLSGLHTYLTTTSINNLQLTILRDRFTEVMAEANGMGAIIGADQPVWDADGAFRTEMLTLLGQQQIREDEANRNRWFAAAAGGALLTVGAVVVGPALAVGALNLVGFSSVGPVAGSLAATIQSIVYGGAVGSGSIFALCQSAAMGGIVVGSAAEIAAGVAALGAGARLLGGLGNDAAYARAEAEAKAKNRWFLVTAGGALLMVGTNITSLAVAVGAGLLGLALALGAVVVGPALATGAAVVGLAFAGGAVVLGLALAGGAVVLGPALAGGTVVLGPPLALGAIVVGPALAAAAAAAFVGVVLAGGAMVLGLALSLSAIVVGPALTAAAAVVNLALAVGTAVVNLALAVGTAVGGAALTAGALKLAGSSSVGPVAGSPAVTIESIRYGDAVVSSSLVALCQSAAIRGIAAGNAAEIAAGVAALGAGARLLYGMGTDGPDNNDDDE
ncbi:hypothetical protein FRC01_004165, partial [Tulasnella sp. 417]